MYIYIYTRLSFSIPVYMYSRCIHVLSLRRTGVAEWGSLGGSINYETERNLIQFGAEGR